MESAKKKFRDTLIPTFIPATFQLGGSFSCYIKIKKKKVSLNMVELFRGYHPDKTGHMDRMTDGRMERVLPIAPPPHLPGVGDEHWIYKYI